jgi:hypothetical protein
MPISARNLYSGAVAVAAGVLTAVLIYVHPESLRVPRWVAYVACGAFVLAGFAVIAQSGGASVAYRWLVVGVIGAMLVPPLWAALGVSPPTCSAEVLGSLIIPAGVACRALWAVSSLLLAVIFIMVVRWALRG